MPTTPPELLETLRTLILDAQEARWEVGVPRRFRMPTVPRKAAVCIGVRRSGKSTFLFQTMERLVRSGVPRERLLYLNLFDDRLAALRQTGLAPVLEAYYGLFPEAKDAATVHCFLDEVQMVPGWERFVDRLLRTERCEVALTGSSAQLLSREVATQMRGRAIAWELFPFSFREVLDSRGVDAAGPLSTRRRLLVQREFERYWEHGGFPEVLAANPAVRVRTHQEYLHAILYRDLVERHDVSHPRAVSDLARRLVESTASLYSLNAATGYLRSLGHKVPKSSVADYLQWFEDAYFLFTVRLHDPSLARANANPKKIYCIDHGLVHSVASGVRADAGHRLENLAFIALRRVSPELHYYRTRNGREVDLVVPSPDPGPRLIQVCETLTDPATRKREVTALAEAMGELGVGEGTLVTRAEEERIDVLEGTIRVVPMWRFLLEQPDAAEVD